MSEWKAGIVFLAAVLVITLGSILVQLMAVVRALNILAGLE